MARVRIPEPLAGRVGAGSGGTGMAAAEGGYGEGAEQARHAAGAQRPAQEFNCRKVMVLGAGLIGSALAARLVLRGHCVLLATRNGRAPAGMDALALDLTAALPDAQLRKAMSGVDVVVNTVGIFLESGQQTFDAVHVNGPRAVFEAARAANVRRWVQLSALGADAESPLPYFASKGRMDAILRDGDGDGHVAGSRSQPEVAIVKPSLVFAPEGASTRWFAQLASLPLTPLPGHGRHAVQPVHLDDLVDALVALVESPEVPPVLHAVGPQSLPMRDYLQVFKRAMATGRAFVPIPMRLLRTIAAVASRIGKLPVDADALSMLEAGSTAEAGPFQRWLGRPARGPEAFVDHDAAARMRRDAVLAWTVPVMRLALAAMWIATAVVSLWVYPRDLSLAMLAQVGLHGGAAVAALWAGALADVALGLGMLLAR